MIVTVKRSQQCTLIRTLWLISAAPSINRIATANSRDTMRHSANTASLAGRSRNQMAHSLGMRWSFPDCQKIIRWGHISKSAGGLFVWLGDTATLQRVPRQLSIMQFVMSDLGKSYHTLVPTTGGRRPLWLDYTSSAIHRATLRCRPRLAYS